MTRYARVYFTFLHLVSYLTIPIELFKRSIPSNLPLRTIIQAVRVFRRPDNSSREGGSRGLNLLTFLYFLNRIQQIWPTPTRKPMRALTEADISHDGPSLSGPASWFVGGVSLINRIVFSHTRQ